AMTSCLFCFFFQAEDGIRDFHVTGVQTCALPIYSSAAPEGMRPASRTPLKLEPVSAAPKRKPRKPRWTLMLVPPPRVPSPVRTVELKRRHALPPVMALVVAVAFVAFASAQVGVWTHEAMMEPE